MAKHILFSHGIKRLIYDYVVTMIFLKEDHTLLFDCKDLSSSGIILSTLGLMLETSNELHNSQAESADFITAGRNH